MEAFPQPRYAHAQRIVLGRTQRAYLDVGRPGVNELAGVLANHPDLVLCHELLDGLPRKRAVDVQPLAEDGRGDELVLGRLCHELGVRVLVEQDKVVRFLLHLSLGPLLFLRALGVFRRSLRRPCGGVLRRLALSLRHDGTWWWIKDAGAVGQRVGGGII